MSGAGNLPAERPPITAALTGPLMAKLKEQFASGASDADIHYFREVALHLELDPWAGHIVLVPYGNVYRPQLTVAGRRWIAQRTGRLRAIDGPYWCGPRRFVAVIDPETGRQAVDPVTGEKLTNRLPLEWVEVWDDDDEYPYAARTLVYVAGWDKPANGTVKWSEFYQTKSGKSELSATWAKMPSHMLGKVSESLALRRAFSEVQAAVSYAGGSDDESVLLAEAAAEAAPSSVEPGPPAPSVRGEVPAVPGPASPTERARGRHPSNDPGQSERVPDDVYDNLPESRNYRGA